MREVCNNSEFDIKTYRLRHPSRCKFYTKFRSCKFDPFTFLHINNENNIERLISENNVIKEKLREVEESLKELNGKESETLEIIKKFKHV